MFTPQIKTLITVLVSVITLCVFAITAFAGGATLTFQGWIGEFKHTRPVWEHIKKTFEEEHPGVKINYQGVPYEQSRRQMIIRAMGGNAPDVTQFVAQWVPQVATIKAVIPLDKYFSEKLLKDIPKGVLESSKYKGKLYSFPWHPGAICLARNKNLMQEAGLDPKQAPQTWDELTRMIERIGALGPTKGGEKIYGIALRTSKHPNSAFWTFPVIWGFGGKFADEEGNIVFGSSLGVIKAFKWYKKMAQGEYSPIGLHITEVRNVFGHGRAGFILEGPWTRGLMGTISGGKFKYNQGYDVSLMPKAPDGISHAIANNHVLIVSRQCKEKELALEFIRHATSKDIAIYDYKRSGLTTTPFKSLLTASPFGESPYIQTFVKQLKTANAAPFKHPKWSACLEFIATGMQKVIMGEKVEPVVKETADNIRTLLGR